MKCTHTINDQVLSFIWGFLKIYYLNDILYEKKSNYRVWEPEKDTLGKNRLQRS